MKTWTPHVCFVLSLWLASMAFGLIAAQFLA